MGVSQNNIRNNQNFEICATICRPGSTTTIKSKAEPGGSTLSRSIFAFLENRDNTNVDSNPTKTSMNLKNLAQGNFSNWPNASPSRQASSDTWRHHQTERGTVGGTCEEPVVHLEGVRPPVVQLSLNDHDQHDQHDRMVWAPARFSTASPLLPALPLAALLSQHHSHFLASPVGYLYERGDR